jgi:tRNA U34 5-methylaminomethyl-2-thiouridine-forming methyltransferase MnmC
MTPSNREFQKTKDGSLTIFSERFRETYHNEFGALTESIHVYIEAGLRYRFSQSDGLIRIGEIGLGTGMNAMLALQAAEQEKRKVSYVSIEAYPISKDMIRELSSESWADARYEQMMSNSEGVEIELGDYFKFCWHHDLWPESTPFHQLDVLFYDAFSPNTQPELWDLSACRKAWESMAVGGVLVTYCCKGDVKRNLKEVGFKIKKLAGPPGKAEMLRALKLP